MKRGRRSIEPDRMLSALFVALFLGMVATVWVPVEPIVLGVPFWAGIALALMIVSVIAAGFAGWYCGWPN